MKYYLLISKDNSLMFSYAIAGESTSCSISNNVNTLEPLANGDKVVLYKGGIFNACSMIFTALGSNRLRKEIEVSAGVPYESLPNDIKGIIDASRDLLVEISEADFLDIEQGIMNSAFPRVASTSSSRQQPTASPSDFKPEQIILYGVPGCGKSHKVQLMLDEWEIPEERTRRVVFSPDYCSADFLGQILPTDVNGHVRYEFKPGPFTEILRKAYHDQSHEYALVIEEINRGNAAAIFSEVFQLLDRLKAPKGQYCAGWSEYCVHNDILQSYVGFPDGEGIRLPPNLTLLATMNTSDQNVYTLDNAFQRRWDMRLVSNKLDENSDQYKSPIEGLDCSWGKFRDEVNRIIVSSSASTGLSSLEDKRLGGWFVEADDSGEIPKDTFAYKVLKYLWDDALKMDRPSLFKNGLERTLEDVIEDYKDNNLGPAIFIDSFIEALTAK